MAPEQLFEKISDFKNTNVLYIILEYNIQVLTIEMTLRKPWCIRVQISFVSFFYTQSENSNDVIPM